MQLPKAKTPLKRDFFQCRMKPVFIKWIIKKAVERGMSYGEFIEAMFEPVIEREKERCAKQKLNSTSK